MERLTLSSPRMVLALALSILGVALVVPAQASEVGHHSPALSGIPDFIMPAPESYYIL